MRTSHNVYRGAIWVDYHFGLAVRDLRQLVENADQITWEYLAANGIIEVERMIKVRKSGAYAVETSIAQNVAGGLPQQ